jgi:hypothetical protein
MLFPQIFLYRMESPALILINVQELESLVSQILLPLVHSATSAQNMFTSGVPFRSVLLYRALDVVYLLGLRIGQVFFIILHWTLETLLNM